MLSQRIIQFITNLPHFQHDKVDGNFVATRLTDGTVFLPSHEPGDNERGLLYAHWQGDSARRTLVIGTQIASLEIVAAVKSEDPFITKQMQKFLKFLGVETVKKFIGL